MPRRRTGNAINSLFEGIARGLSLGRQLQNQRRNRELQERGLDISEEGLEIKKGTLALQQKQFLQGLLNTQRALQQLETLKNPGMPQLDLSGSFNQPQQSDQAIPTTPQQPTTNLATGNDISFGPQPGFSVRQPQSLSVQTPIPSISPRTAPEIQSGIQEETIPGSGRTPSVTRNPVLDLPFMTSPEPEQPSRLPQVQQVPSRATDIQVRKQQEQRGTTEINKAVIKDIKEFGNNLALQVREGQAGSATFSGGEGSGLSTTENFRGMTPNRAFTIFRTQVENSLAKRGIKLPSGFLSKVLENNPALANAPNAKAQFEREFTNEVIKKEKEFSGGMRLSTGEQFQRRKDAVNAVLTENKFGGFIPEKFNKFISPDKPAILDVKDPLSFQLSRLGFDSPEDLLVLAPEEQKQVLDKAAKASGFEVVSSGEVLSDGKTTKRTTLLRDPVTRELKTKNFEVSNEALGRLQGGRDAFQTGAQKEALKLNSERNQVVRTVETFKDLVGDFNGLTPGERQVVTTPAGGFQKFMDTFVDTIGGFGVLAGFDRSTDSNTFTEALRKSSQFKSRFGQLTTKTQKFLTKYGFGILQFAASSPLAGQGGRLTDRDIQEAKELLTSRGVNSFEGSMQALFESQNLRREELNREIIQLKNPQNIFDPVAPFQPFKFNSITQVEEENILNDTDKILQQRRRR